MNKVSSWYIFTLPPSDGQAKDKSGNQISETTKFNIVLLRNVNRFNEVKLTLNSTFQDLWYLLEAATENGW